ncbi:MAG: hypothetical protein Q7J29_13620 [Stagnimonas sp.]|nr:hypothetical protein [Stagnimonas sp.]
MNAKYTLLRGCKNYNAFARRSDRDWGRATEVKVQSIEGQTIGNLVFGCHPDFVGFNEYQAMSYQHMLNLIAERLDGDVEVNRDALISGLIIYICLNGPNPSLVARMQSGSSHCQ